MTIYLKRLAVFGGLAAGMLGATPAFAAGTASGTTITNNVSVNYSVGGVSQTALNASNNITVDRRINLTVVEVGTVTTTVAPGQTAAVTTFTVTNTSNAALDLGLSVTQPVGGTAAHGGTDNFDVTGVQIAVDTNGNGTYEAGTDTIVTFLDEIAADAARTVFVLGNIPAGQANGSVAEVNLVAQAREAGTAGSQGAVSTETAGANTAGVDTVFGDTAGTAAGDGARDGRHSDDDDYTVLAALLSVTKQSRVLSDPFNLAVNPKMIPGATVEYCIVVVNAAGGGAADSVAISDAIPANTTFVAGSIRLNGTYTGTVPTGTCNGDGVAGGSFAANTVSGNLGTIAAGNTRTLYFNVTIN
jgi:uncharacterized repeat protein (TIGR01451 family)